VTGADPKVKTQPLQAFTGITMFLDSFPMQMQMPEKPDNRAVRPLREPVAVDAGKSRSAWPFIVTDKGSGISHTPQAPVFTLAAPSSFVT
jgi:hypothetical protein